MGTEGMDAFLQSRGLQVNMPLEGSMTSHHVNEAISDALRIAGKSDSMELYLASEQDMHHIERLVYGLSVYEKETDVIHVNRQHYVVDMSLYKCLLMKNRNDEHVCGMAFFYFGYDLSRGSFLYLEDLFIEEPYRGDGGGTLAMVALASVARTLGCTGWVWQALDWNTPALNFYHKLGAKVLRGLLTTRFNGPDLKEFLDNRPLKV
jgi:GNAT superfamily N-acetyltransferase